MDNLEKYLEYHKRSSLARDIDPANDTLRYLCNRFELNIEQRYWMAFLYACSYSATTTYYIYNEFPDFENVDLDRLQIWWDKNKTPLIFQTDRLRVKSSNQFVDAFVSYKRMIGNRTQHDFFRSLCTSTSGENYNKVYNKASEIFTFGRFTLFIYLEMVNVLTDLAIQPTHLDLKEAESCRNGLVLAFDLNELFTHGTDKKINGDEVKLLQGKFTEIYEAIQLMEIDHKNIWNIETTLCAYKKYRLGKRYVGYYIERSGKELSKLTSAITSGVDWTPLWQFREETYNHKFLSEKKQSNGKRN
jgi:hypothetical protein